MEIKGRTILITGSARRVGRHVAFGLARLSADIIIHYNKSKSEAFSLQKEIKSLGVNCWTIKADLNSKTAHTKIFDSISKIGALDVLINNASVFDEKSVDMSTFEDISADVLTNAWSPFELSREFTRRYKNGKIINVLDSRINGNDPKHFTYFISKSMLSVMTKTMALRFAPNFTVNGIAPGIILPPESKTKLDIEKSVSLVPLKKKGDPDDVLKAIRFLIESDFVTGQTLYVDGGQHLAPRYYS